jgi:hypothetical protein
MTAATVSKAEVMRAAWVLFRREYGYGPRELGGEGKSFKYIGRASFAWCLRKAWADAKRAAGIAPTKAERVRHLREQIKAVRDSFTTSFSVENRRVAALEAEIGALLAA